MKQLLSTISKSARVGMAAIFVAAVSSLAYSEAPKISGFIDTSYQYNLNKPATGTNGGRSHDATQNNDFYLNAVQINIDGAGPEEGVGYHGELSFGTDRTVFNAGQSAVDVQEAYLTYKCPLSSIMLKAGKFVTFAGIEVIESKDNFTITRGGLYGLAEAFTHVGVLAGYQATSAVDVWLGVVNGWDLDTDNNSGKTLLGKVGMVLSDNISGSVSFSHGPENATDNLQRDSIDTTWFIKPMQDVTIGLQFNAGEQEKAAAAGTNNAGADAHWYGFGIQPKLDLTDKFSLGARYEWFSDQDGARITYPAGHLATHGTGVIGQNITLAPAYKLTDSLLFRAEFRHDMTSNGVFERNDGTFTKNSQQTVATELIYTF